MRVLSRLFGLLALGAALSGASLAGTHPSRAVHLIVPDPPGGVADITRLPAGQIANGIAAQGDEILVDGPEHFQADPLSVIDQWHRAIRRAGLKAQ